ncbi:tRNA epoxyqueuosine(34) reductase QueG [Hyphomicrobium sp.]|uniref:tRNA epoxyqueuosine(34) reductase QueG n=1 Tax=Hyphomicrobium sp. TaxID=82 RepID=UPI002D7945FB|nr:tRNA epoxyqueuosine(34) reductase QueG [Hyphomicrobium sp.]HET6388508.1 tRNA epoxyqueuosine(34) reductase QueG [Hyphomicrobium sp.]
MIRTEASTLGLDAVGIARLADDPELSARLAHFLSEKRHGDMDWMETHADRRSGPLKLWPEARSAIIFGQSYAPPDNPLDALAHRSNAAISVYAKGRDYHDVLKKKIKSFARSFAERSGADVKVFVDTAPLMEKPLAAKAGLGWQGKHTILVSRDHGNWLFLGIVLTTAELESDSNGALTDHCGSCRRCLDVCPTNAFPAPYQLDARRCIAYLTIEHKGHIAPEFRAPIGNRVFGCDDCAAVCPWNKFASTATEMRYAARPETDNPPLAELLALNDAAFRARFAGTPIKRTGRDRVVRNALIAAGNSGDRSLLGQIENLIGDNSALVRAMAIWASRRLANPAEAEALRERYQAQERDAEVAAEWTLPMEGFQPA